MKASGSYTSSRGHKQKLWVVRLSQDKLQGLLTEELFLFNTTCIASLFSVLSVVFVAAGVAVTALIHIEGAFEESTSVPLFYPLYTSPYLHLSVFSLRFCLYFSLKTLCIPSFNFCFSHSHLPALVPVPSSFLTPFLLDFILLFCRVTLLVRNCIF